ncbi:hypothetical protein HPB50_011938 [Hyalomma asiaticum]|uniref:Uncharacterized protein n=1 Tax=Hyalomma asiaticum TaxID=266040 RepID=A0ACB7SU27_HYAAI|nr:hypothetical protein HPB50_011938 [Hyalomma asiaticum]
MECPRRRGSYMYCVTPMEGYYYDGKLKECVATRDEQYFVCNNGPNRFANENECLTDCVQRSAPKPHCEEVPVFVPCERRHLRRTWWFYDGTGCVEWNFATGECPNIGSAGLRYETESACADSCMKDPVMATFLGCYAPGGGDVCSVDDMLHPFFAFRDPDGKMRCHSADINTINKHRCVEDKAIAEHPNSVMEETTATAMFTTQRDTSFQSTMALTMHTTVQDSTLRRPSVTEEAPHTTQFSIATRSTALRFLPEDDIQRRETESPFFGPNVPIHVYVCALRAATVSHRYDYLLGVQARYS